MIPGISPLRASSRKQSRHISNFRIYPLERPHFLHRLLCLSLYLGVFKYFAIDDFLATLSFLYSSINGIPIFLNKKNASLSFLAEVTIVIFIPCVLFTFV